MMDRIEWQALVEAKTRKQALKKLDLIRETLGAPLRLTYLDPDSEWEGTYFMTFHSPLGFENPWEAFFKTHQAALRISSTWLLEEPRQYEEGEWTFHGVVQPEGFLIEGLRFMQFWTGTTDPTEEDSPEEEELTIIDVHDDLAPLLSRHREVGLPFVRNVLQEYGPAPAPPLPMTELASGYSLSQQEPLTQVSAAVAAQERYVVDLLEGREQQAERLLRVVMHFRWQDLPYSGEDVVTLLALGSVMIDADLSSTCLALHLPLAAATSFCRTHRDELETRDACVEILSLLEEQPNLYQENADLIRHLKQVLQETATIEEEAPSPFAPIDPWGRAMLDMPHEGAEEFLRFLSRGTQRGRPRKKWVARCERFLEELPTAERELRDMTGKLIELSRSEPEPIRLGIMSRGDNERLLKGAIWCLPHLQAAWVAERLADLCLFFEQKRSPLVQACIQSLRQLPAGQGDARDAAFRRIRQEATGHHLRMEAERAISGASH